MKTLKRTISTITAIGMLLAMVPTNAAARAEKNSVNVFETFTEFNGFTAINESWHGFKLPYYEAAGRPNLIAAAKDEESFSKVLKKWNWGTVAYQFDEAVNSGKMHISFDMKTDRNAEKQMEMTFGGYHTALNTDPNDLRYEGENRVYSNIFRIKKNEDKIRMQDYAYKNTNFNKECTTVDNAWHKYDIAIDFDATDVATSDGKTKLFGECSVYRDGESIGTTYLGRGERKTGGLKGLFMDVKNDNTNNVYLDNFVVSQYNDGNLNAPIMKAEYDSQNAKADVVFSEIINTNDWSNAVSIYDKNNTIVNGVSAEKISGINGVRLNLPKDLSAGVYTLKANAALKGEISNKGIENTQNFVVTSALNPESAHMYIDESFEGYKGGMPADFKEVLYNGYNESLVSALTADSRDDNNTALKLGGTGDKAVAYEFDNSIYSGKFTVEFDVKHSNSGWSFGLMDESDFFDDTDYISYAGYNHAAGSVSHAYWMKEHNAENIDAEWDEWHKAKSSENSTLTNKEYYFKNWTENKFASEKTESPELDWYNIRIEDINNRRTNNTLIGNMDSKSTTDFTKLYTAEGKANLGDTELTGITVSADAWSHIKAVVDLDAGTYSFYINKADTPVVVNYNQALNGNYENGRFSRTYLRDTDGNYKVLGGIAGLRIQKSGDGTASFDNIKVYTDKYYNDYLDFNTNTVGSTQPGWYSNKAKAWNELQNFGNNGENQRTMVDGASSTENDKAIKFTQGWQYYTHPFAVPVKAGKAFDVEFDLKAEDNSRWVLELLDDRYMTRNVDNSYSDSNNAANSAIAFNGEKGTAGGQDKHIIEKNGVLTNQYKTSDGLQNGFSIPTATESALGQNSSDFTTSAEIDYKTDEWQHIKLTIDPQNETTTNLTLAVTYADSTTKNYGPININKSWYKSAASRFYKYDTCGLGFYVPNDIGKGIAIDNLKVSEADSAAVSIASIESVGLDDKTSDVGDEVAMPIKSLRVNLTAPLDSANGVELYYANRAKNSENYRPGYTTTLSEDKMSVNVALLDYVLNEYITLNVSNKSEFVNSNLVSVPTTATTFKLTGNSDANYDNIEITEFRLYEYLAERTDGNTVIPATWAPIITNSIAKGSKIKIVAKGVNYGAPIDAMLTGAEYTDKNGTNTLSYMMTENAENSIVPSGVFAKELLIDSTERMFDEFKAMFWSMPDCRPFSATVSVKAE